jgi:DNA-binding transcriptional MerR regulator/effector-binding domain-containing protein
MGMPPREARLLTIGEFSRLSRLSVRMLRYYDDHGVLRPTRTDASGYRRYSPNLLETAHQLRRLRDVGLSVAELAACAPRLHDAAAMRAVLERQRERLRGESAAVAARLWEVDHLITTLEEPTMTIDIAHRSLPARTVASVRGVIGTYADEGQLWERLMAALPAAGARLADAPRAVAVFHDDDYVESDADVEVQIDVAEAFRDTGDLRCVTVAEQQIASGMLYGGYEGIGDVMTALGNWVAEQGYRFAGPMFNIYLVGPGQEPDPTRWVTEVCVPVAKDTATP